MESTGETSSAEQEYSAGVRLVMLNLPEDEGEGLGFRVTRTLWDPYPWVRDVTTGSRADAAGLTSGDCLLQIDGKDLLGLPVGQVASLIRGDGAGRGVSLLVWSCGVDPSDDPELLWSCGGGARGERARRALGGVLRALACCVCAATASRALTCARSHLYCEGCWSRLERCALCREPLPPRDSPRARNLVAEQVFEAIATEYEIKNTMKRTTESVSAYNTPNRSPNLSPSTRRKGEYQLSMMNRKKPTQLQSSDKFGQNYASDPNIQISLNRAVRRTHSTRVENPSTKIGGNKCCCQSQNSNGGHGGIENVMLPSITVENTDQINQGNKINAMPCANFLQHKLVTRIRQACSMADLPNVSPHSSLSQSLNNVCFPDNHCGARQHSSLENLKPTSCDQPVFVVSPPPIYVLTCDHHDK